MVDRNLIKDFDISDADIDAQLAEAFGEAAGPAAIERAISPQTGVDLDFNTIVKARIVAITGNEVVLDVGLKSEGVVGLDEWDDSSQVKAGDEVDVLVEDIESETGMIIVSKRRADRIISWRRIVET